MKKQQIIEIIKSLANSQGFYCRLLEHISSDPEYLNMLESKNFKDEVELIMYFEG